MVSVAEDGVKRGGDEVEERLEKYNAMRDFAQTDEPAGRPARRGRQNAALSFVVQKHDATRLHYDFRLELDGVLLSWAVPKGPSLDPRDKRLAVPTEDHPFDYRDFEGTIPAGQYGGGPVIVWDRGTWTPKGDPRAGLAKGKLEFELAGEKLRGGFVLVRTHGGSAKKPTWLLLKRDDDAAQRTPKPIVDTAPASVLTGRTIADIVAGVPAAAASTPAKTKRAKTKRAKTRRAKTKADGKAQGSATTKHRRAAAKTAGAPLPDLGSVAPQLATLVTDVPVGPSWIFEIKYDGYRTLAWLDDGAVRLASRKGLDWTAKYPTIAAALAGVRARSAIFDGEIAYVLEDGRTDFQKLQATLGGDDPAERARLVYFVFDLLFYDGVDLRGEPLAARKAKLRTILAGEKPPLRMSDDVVDGAPFLREACKVGLEGIIGKRADLPYHAGRSPAWVKVKCQKRQELVIVGFTPPRGTRKGIGALLLGVHEGQALRYAGKVGTGFSQATLDDLAARLPPLEVTEPPVTGAPRLRGARWVAPKLVGEVRFTEWTKDGALRHPSFEGLRLDKGAREVHVERAAPPPAPTLPRDAKPRVEGIVVSHPDRVMDIVSGLSKLDLVRYVGAVAEATLPYVKDRPLMLLRCPGGVDGSRFQQGDRRRTKARSTCFVQKHHGQGLGASSHIGQATLGTQEALFVRRARDLVTLAQNNTVELHGWGTRLPAWEHPDTIVLDLDPDEALPFTTVIDAAFELREALATLSLVSWVKTTGGKGLHVVVPIARRYDWDTVKKVAQRIAQLMAESAPRRWVATMTKAARQGKIFLDWLRNAEGATAVLPYSPRARPGLPVAYPVAWSDLRAIDDPRAFTIETVPALLAARRTDPWEDLLTTHQALPKLLRDAVR